MSGPHSADQQVAPTPYSVHFGLKEAVVKRIRFPKGAPIVLVITAIPTPESGIGPLPRNEEQANQLRQLDAQRLRARIDDESVNQVGEANLERRQGIRSGDVTREDADTGRQPINGELRNTRRFRQLIERQGYALININSAVKESRNGNKNTVVYAKFAIGITPTTLVTEAAGRWLDEALDVSFRSVTVWINPLEVNKQIVKNATVNLGGKTGENVGDDLEFDFYEERTAAPAQ